MATAIVIDTRSRRIEVSVCSLTVVTEGSSLMVARKGINLGPLDTFSGALLEHPTLLLTAGYRAQSSEGFVDVHLPPTAVIPATLVGGTGWGWHTLGGGRRGDALRAFKRPEQCVLLPPGAALHRLRTHTNSNAATAAAAREGLEMLARDYQLVIAEGQSDWAHGWAVGPTYYEGWGVPVLRVEHRQDIFVSGQSVAV